MNCHCALRTHYNKLYKGDCSKWLKFANTLKLRMAIRISGVEPEYAQTKAQEAVLGGVMESVGDSSYDTTNGGINENGYAIVSGWPEVRANACLVSYMNGYNDPRRPAYFTPQYSDCCRWVCRCPFGFGRNT